MQSKVSFTPLWSGLWNSSGTIHLAQPASAFDALRFNHYEWYQNMGSYKCTDVPTGFSQGYSVYLPFYENNWYVRNFCVVPANNYNDISARSRQQVYFPSGTGSITASWSGEGSVANSNFVGVYGIKYQDTDPYDENKIYADRTLLFSQDDRNNSAMTSFNVSEDLRHFNFIEWEMNNAMGNVVCPGSANAICPWFILQSDTNWYIRATQWSATNNFRSYVGKQYTQNVVTVSSNNTIGSIPAPYQRNVNPVKVYGIGRKKIRKLTILPSDHGSMTSDITSGYPGLDTATLTNTPDTDWYFSGYNITGATLTGNKFTFGDQDVTAQAVFADTPQVKTLTLQTDGHGSLTANKVTGYEGDTVTLTRAPSARYNNSAYSVTGGTINGNTFTFGNQDATAKAWFSAASYSAYRLMITGMAAILSYPNRYCQLQEYGLGYSNGGPYYGPNYWTITSTAMSGTYWTSNRKLAQLFDGNIKTEAGKWDAYNFTAARVDFRTKNSNRVVPQKVGMVMAYYNSSYTGAKPTTDLYGYNNDRGTYELIKHINATALPNGNTASYTAAI